MQLNNAIIFICLNETGTSASGKIKKNLTAQLNKKEEMFFVIL